VFSRDPRIANYNKSDTRMGPNRVNGPVGGWREGRERHDTRADTGSRVRVLERAGRDR